MNESVEAGIWTATILIKVSFDGRWCSPESEALVLRSTSCYLLTALLWLVGVKTSKAEAEALGNQEG